MPYDRPPPLPRFDSSLMRTEVSFGEDDFNDSPPGIYPLVSNSSSLPPHRASSPRFQGNVPMPSFAGGSSSSGRVVKEVVVEEECSSPAVRHAVVTVEGGPSPSRSEERSLQTFGNDSEDQLSASRRLRSDNRSSGEVDALGSSMRGGGLNASTRQDAQEVKALPMAKLAQATNNPQTLRYLVPFPVSIFNFSKSQWHPSCFVQFLFQKAVVPTAQGFYVINDSKKKDLLPTSVTGVIGDAWPYETDRMFFPMSCITFLYGDSETKDAVEQRSRIRTFCASLSAGLSPCEHPADELAFKEVGSYGPEIIAFRYLPSLLLPPVHETTTDGSVKQRDDLSPWEAVNGMPIVDPQEERLLLIRCASPEAKDELLAKIIEALQSHYEPLRPEGDGTGRNEVRNTLEAEFDRLTFYRHCVRRVYQMHFLRRLLLTGAEKQPSMFLTLWSTLPEDECMRNLLQTHSSNGTIERLLIRIRTLVSLKKVRFMQDGFNLDMALITPNIIAMGFPSSGSQALMRNPIEEVMRYFEVFWGCSVYPVSKDSLAAHVGQDIRAFQLEDAVAVGKYLSATTTPRFRIYNLCSERHYPPSRFAGSFERFPSDDHNPPPLHQMLAFCQSAEAFLKGNDSKDATHPGSPPTAERVVAIHCKAGKGRTGVMIVALMLFMKLFDTFDGALQHYNQKRTRDGKGITIASQIRFLRYFVHCLSEIGRCLPTKRPVKIRGISFSPIPWFDMDGGCTPFFKILQRKPDHWHFPLGQREIVSDEGNTMVVRYDSQFLNGQSGPEEKLSSFAGSERASFRILGELELVDEIQFMFFNKGGRLLHTEYMFSFWIHTSFLDDRAAVVMFGRDEVDGASKEHKDFFDPGFIVEVEYTALAPVA